MSGDLTLYKPGSEVTATLVADATGDIPARGDGVEITGENPNHPEVGVISEVGTFLGTLVDLPPNFDEAWADDFTGDEEVGEVNILVRHYVDWMDDSAGTLDAGDLVVADTDGVVVYDGGVHDEKDIVGRVFKTHGGPEGTDGKVAVVRYN